MEYVLKLTPLFERQLKKIKKRDKVLFSRLTSKLKVIRKNPEHYKPLKNVLKGFRRVHVDPFVVIFDICGNVVMVHYVKHHDESY